MKILIFIDDMGAGGKQRRLLELIKGLMKSEEFEILLVLTQKEILYQEILTIGVDIEYCLRRTKRDLSVFARLYKTIKSFDPDILHVWGNLEALYMLPSKILLGIPLLNSQITDAPSVFRKRFLNHKLTFPFSNIITSNSHAGLEAYHVNQSKGVVVYNGYDFNRNLNLKDVSLVKEQLGIGNQFVAGMFASFESRKDYGTFMRSINILAEQNLDIKFMCVGDEDYSPYQEMLSEKALRKTLFLGHQKDVESLMNICDIGVLTTFTEGISNSLLEMMSLGKACVVSGAGGCKETVANGVSGFLHEPEDFKKVAQSIRILYDDKDLRIKMGKEGVNIVKNKFSIEKMVEEFQTLYRQLYRIKH